MNDSRRAFFAHRRAPRAMTAALTIAVLAAATGPARAQTSSTTTTAASITNPSAGGLGVAQPNSVGVPVSVTTTTNGSSPSSSNLSSSVSTSTPTPPVTVTLSHELPPGFTNANQPLGQQRTIINVVNQGPATLFNQQMVVRMGNKPDTIYLVRDSTGSVGVIDGPSGIWFHTIAQLNPSSSALYIVTWNKACPGRWPLGARVGDAVSWQVFQWISPSAGPNCPPDDTAKPEPPVLPWPASFPTPAVIAPVLPSTTTLPVVTGSTTTSTIRPSVTVAPSTITIPANLTSPSVPNRTRTTMLFCRTVGKKRVCGPMATKPKPTPATTTTRKAKS